MTSFRADLHCHSTCSDGSLTPVEIIHLAKEKELSGLSITDHDTVGAYATAIPAARELQIQLLTGVEFSASTSDTSVHILGYGFDPENNVIADFCAKHTERRTNRNQAILQLLSLHGMPLTEEDLQSVVPQDFSKRTIGRPHIALAMVKKGYVESVQEAFKNFLSENKPCYSPGIPLSAEETLAVIHQANGIAVIAHPHLIPSTLILKKLLEMDFDGIECYYGKFPRHEHERWLKIARHRGWLITGGSDFHGAVKPSIELGSSWIDADAFQKIQDKLHNKI